MDPGSARTAAEYVELLRRLRATTELSYRQISQRARVHGEALPASTLATALNRDTLPRREIVAAMVRACGGDRTEVDRWLTARRRLLDPTTAPAAGPAPARTGTGPVPPPAPVWSSGRNPWDFAAVGLVGIALVLLLCAADSVPRLTPSTGTLALPPATGPQGTAKLAGRVRLRPAGTNLCVSERPGSNTGYLYAAACATAIPTLVLDALPNGEYRIRTMHPQYGPGCMGVDASPNGTTARPSDGYCARIRDQEFRLVPAALPGGYRLRFVATGLCAGLDTAPGLNADIVFAVCNPAATRQVFVIGRY